MERQISQSFSFQRVLRDINCQNWQKYKMSYFEALFAQMFEQKWLLCKIMLCQFFDEKISLHEKYIKSSGPKENVELIQGRSEAQSNNSDFIRNSVYRVIQRKTGHLSSFLDILFIYHFELILGYVSSPYRTQLIFHSHTKSQLHVSILIWDIRFSGILQSD